MTRTRNASPAPEPTGNEVTVFDPAAAGRQLQRRIEDRRPQLAALLSVDLETERGRAMLDRFVTVALHAATSNPDLIRCTTDSLVEAIRQSAILGLEPTGALGDGAMVVYNETVSGEVLAPSGRGMIVVKRQVPTARFQPMYRGLLKLARRSDQLLVIDSNVVYEADGFSLSLGMEPRIDHDPVISGERGGYLGAYAFAKLRTGETLVEWMSYADIEAVRKTSRAKDNGPWVTFWSEMARKTVLRRLMKRLPLESAAEHAIRLDVEAEANAVSVASPESAQMAATPRARLLSRLGAGPAEEQAPPPDPAVSGDPGASQPPAEETKAPEDVEEGQARPADGLCGSESDPALGSVETCALEVGHLDGDGPKRHQAASGTVWPAANEGAK